MTADHITHPYTLDELRAKIASNEYSAEMLLQHAMLLLDRPAPAEAHGEVLVTRRSAAMALNHLANNSSYSPGALAYATSLLVEAAPSDVQPKGTEAPALPAVAEARGFVAFGAGVYRVCQTVEPGLVVTFRRPGEEDRAVGERNAAPDLTPIPPEEIIVRLEFRNVAGLDSLEDHLREIRQQHWPETVPNLLVDAMAHANANAWAVTREWARGWNDARLAIAKAHLAPSPAPAPVEMAPEFTDSARAALLWVLWHHQGGSSPVGQPIRFALGMGADDRLSEHQIGEAKRWAGITGWTTERVQKYHPSTAAPADQAPAVVDGALTKLLAHHATLLEHNPYAYFELAYTRSTGWMAWITDKPAKGEPGTAEYARSRKVIASGQGDTPEEAAADALAAMRESDVPVQGSQP